MPQEAAEAEAMQEAEQEAKKRQKAGQERGRQKQAGALVERLPPTDTQKARDAVAQQFGTNPRYVQDAKLGSRAG